MPRRPASWRTSTRTWPNKKNIAHKKWLPKGSHFCCVPAAFRKPLALRRRMCCSIRNTTGKQGSAGSLRALLLFYLWLLHRGLQGRSTRDKSKMKNRGAFLLLLLSFWNKRRYNRMEDDSWGKLISSSGSLAEINPLAECKHIADGEIHYLAETPVPEPWNSWYFGGMP